MASTSSTRSESPVDIDFSVIRTSIQMGHKMIDQILQGIHYGSEEVRNLLREECEFILECKVCRNLFRSFPNFVAHKRVYCMEYYEEQVNKNDLAPVPVDEETVVIQPEAPEETNQKNKKETASSKNVPKTCSDIEKVVNKTFEGKSKEYQFYTKIAEEVEKRKSTKLTNTVTLTSMPATSNAVVVTHAKGDQSKEKQQKASPKKQSPVKSTEEPTANSPAKKKNSVLAVCADLAKKKLMQDGNVETVNAMPLKIRSSTRSRKSSPRKSTDYLNNRKNSESVETEEEMDVEEWNASKVSVDKKERNNDDYEKDLVKFCNLNNLSCRVCERKFTSLYNLKLHGKIKHGISVGKFPCSICESKFEHLKSLYKHLRQKHGKGQEYICNIKRQLLSKTSKESEDIEFEEDGGSSTSSSASPASPKKENKNMLSFSTGWKKCDKCGKVCWKAKSFYRHYSQCKGPNAKSESNSASNSPFKSGKQNTVGSQKNPTALLKLQEKLRAGVIQTASSDVAVKSQLNEKSIKPESRNNSARESAERSLNINASRSGLLKALNQPLNRECEDVRSKLNVPSNSKDSCQFKSYNLRQSHEKEEKATEAISKERSELGVKELEEGEKNKEENVIGSPAFKKLEERLVREAGLNDSQKLETDAEVRKDSVSRQPCKEKVNASEVNETHSTDPKDDNLGRSHKISSENGSTESVTKLRELRTQRESLGIKQLEMKLAREVDSKSYGTRHVTQMKTKEMGDSEKVTVEAIETIQRRRNKSSESSKEDLAKVKEQRLNRESPEIKLLEEKLTRKALGHKIVEDQETNETINNLVTSEAKMNESNERILKDDEDTLEECKEKTGSKVDKTSNESDVVHTFRSSKRSLSGDTENRKERISEKLRERMASQEQMTYDSKTRSSRSISRDNDNKGNDNTPEKLNLMTNLSPVSSPGRSSTLPSSPTPSLQSNSGDSYNMKFKMTVQEMAELVESASLTKFAKERKKRAKSFLNSKQVKESQKVASSLSKPMKRGTRKKNIIIRNVYGTRNKAPENTPTEENIFVPSTRFSSRQSENNETDRSSEHGSEGDATKRLSREQKRLQNSAGFVEKNFYAVTSSRDSSKDRHSDGESEKRQLSRERKRLENSQGYVDKSFQYESDSSIDRERGSLNKSSKGSDKDVGRSEDDDFIVIDSDISIKSPIVKGSQRAEQIIISDETGMLEENAAMKLKSLSSQKKTVLYVGKDFSDKIKSIQRRGSAETEDHRAELDKELRGKNINETDQNKISLGKKLENKTVNVAEEPVQEQRQQLCTNNKDKLEQNTSEKVNQEVPSKHRTRLATGSIFFDSELLKLSPTKMEKKFAELNKGNDITKSGQEKNVHSLESASVRKRLSLSPRRVQIESHSLHQRTKSGPKRFSLSTGVKQCQKCHKTFWKMKAYVFHQVHSPCSDKTLSRLDRKRALSLSPEGTVPEGGRFGAVKKIFKKAKRELKGTEKVLSYDKDKSSEDNGKEPQRMTRHQAGSSLKSFENTEIANNKTNSVEGNGKKDLNNVILKSSASKDSSGQINESITQERNLRKRVTDDKSSSEQIQTDVIPKKISLVPEAVVRDEKETAKSTKKAVDVCIEPGQKADMEPEKEHGESKSNEGINKEQTARNCNTSLLSEEEPGPSTSLMSLFSEDSDDNDSDFSGFSEDDLKQREQELSQMEGGENEKVEDNVKDNDSDGIEEHGPVHDTDFGQNPSIGTASSSQRPVRKSAQNRFSHVEEIWVYKEPGKPTVEKIKGVKNREYVVDFLNPSKLQCHYSKDVDKLIDEKNLKCKQCDTPCTSISNLRRHVIRHLGWKRYKCKQCGYTCYDMSYCRQHVLRAHDQDLTRKNFDKYITDLKKEATKKRSEKRTITMQRSKRQNRLYDEIYKRTKANLKNSTDVSKTGIKQTKVVTPNASDKRSNKGQVSTASKFHRSKEENTTVPTEENFDHQSDGNVVTKKKTQEQSSARKETATSKPNSKTSERPLDKARLNLTKALCNK